MTPSGERASRAVLGTVATGLLTLGGLAALRAETLDPSDWPEFRGPGRAAVAPTSISRNSTPEPRELWRRALGPGFSGIVAVGDDLYTMTSDAEREYLVRLRATSGAEIWRLEVGPLFENSWGNGPRSTPTFDGGILFALGSHGRLVAAEARTGREIWRRELGRLAGVAPPDFGYSPSPILLGGAVVTEVGASDRGLIRGFDRETGDLRWAAESGRAGYGSPIRVATDRSEQAVFLTREAALGIAPNGEVAWRWPLDGTNPYDTPLTSPVAIGDDRVFVSHRAEGGSALLSIADLSPAAPARDNEAIRTLWETRRFVSHLHAPVHDADGEGSGTLYGFHNATLSALDVDTGAIRWRQRGFGKGSVTLAGETLVVAGENGEIALIDVDPTAYRERIRFTALEGRTWTAPTLRGRDLFWRNGREIVAYTLASSATRDAPPASITAHAPSTQAPRLDVEEVLARHREALGGSERLSRLVGHRWSGRYTTNGRPATLTLEASPGSIASTMRGPIVDSGELPERVTWSPVDGGLKRVDGELLPLEADELQSLLLSARTVSPLVNPPEGATIEWLGRAAFDTGVGLHLRVTHQGGWVEDWYLDPETFLPRALSTERWAWGRVREIDYYFSDWRAVDGVRVPFVVEDEFDSFHRRLVVQSYTLEFEGGRREADLEEGEPSAPRGTDGSERGSNREFDDG